MANNASPHLTPLHDWKDYELLDSGDGMKRERWGNLILIRPESSALWPRQNPAAWEKWDGWFQGASGKSGSQAGGNWVWKHQPPSHWHINYRDLNFLLRPTTSKQIGLFPEQATNWDWCSQKIRAAKTAGHPVRLLNLFGYTGAASIAAVAAGATVCHVDASKAMVEWCSENARHLQQGTLPLRFIVDDCISFIAREHRRGHEYDAIILDPPTFGRGRSGELWKLEEHLLQLLKECRALLSNTALFLLLNTYSPNLTPSLLQKVMLTIFGKKESSHISSHHLTLQGTLDQKKISCGITTRWESAL